MIQRDTDTIVVPDGVEAIGDYAFAFWNKSRTKTPLKYITLPASLTKIKSSGFNNCTELELDKLPDNIRDIGTEAFVNCSKITLSEIPSGLTRINFSCFSSCNSLTKIVFKGEMVLIGNSAFYNCTNLTKFSFPNNTAVPTLVSINAIPTGANFTGTIEVPNALLDTWKASTNWAQLTQANWVGI